MKTNALLKSFSAFASASRRQCQQFPNHFTGYYTACPCSGRERLTTVSFYNSPLSITKREIYEELLGVRKWKSIKHGGEERGSI